jgi:hypothetical protein
MIMWYPKLVFTNEDMIGLSTVEGVKAKATSWKAPTCKNYCFLLIWGVEQPLTMLPLTIHPRLPPAVAALQRCHGWQAKLTLCLIFRVLLGNL